MSRLLYETTTVMLEVPVAIVDRYQDQIDMLLFLVPSTSSSNYLIDGNTRSKYGVYRRAMILGSNLLSSLSARLSTLVLLMLVQFLFTREKREMKHLLRIISLPHCVQLHSCENQRSPPLSLFYTSCLLAITNK